MALSISKIIAAAVVLLLIRIDVSGQSTAHAGISATVTEVVGTVHSSVINTGNLIIGSKKAGTIEFNAGGVAGVKEGVNLIRSVNLPDAASVTLIENNFIYAITVPSSAVLKRSGGNETIEVDQFNISSIKRENSETICLGATFKIDALQAAGNYKVITPIPVTVHYN